MSARVFPIEEWAPQSRSSIIDTPSAGMATPRDSVSSTRFRSRLRSLPLGNDTDLADTFKSLSLRNSNSELTAGEDGQRGGGFRGLLRRASVSIKAKRQRRHSHAAQQRPWMHRLREAASFTNNRHSRLLPAQFDVGGPVDSCEELMAPVPGSGSAPPIIPRGSGGAARATAAAQNEYFGRNQHLLFPEDHLGDRESGIGIALTTTEPAQCSDTSISRVDFISQLPVELAIQILAHLDHRSFVHTAHVSRTWARVTASPHIWREVFLREKSKSYAMSEPVKPGAGLGLPTYNPESDWKDLYRIKQQLETNWKEGKAEPVYLNGHLDSIYCVQFDESKIITGSRDKTIRVWNMRTYSCDLVIGPPDIVSDPAIMFEPNGKPRHYATMPDQNNHSAYNPKAVSFDIHHSQSILCLQYDENILVTGSSDSSCIMYDIKNEYTPIRRLRHHTAAVLDLAFDEKYIVTCSKDVSICVWDRETGVMLKQLRGHTGPVNAVQMRGNTIVSCSGDFRVKLWNIDTGKNIREFSGHTKGLACSQFSDDSRFIASAGNDRIIRIWNANTGVCLHKIEAHDNLVRSLHVDSVSGRLISGSYDQDIKVFDMESGRVLLEFPKWHASWVLGAKSDYRRIISTGQDPKILIMDFGMSIKGIERLES